MASLVGYQNLHNLTSLQQSLPEATCLVNGTERVNEATSCPASIAPLNLSVNSSSKYPYHGNLLRLSMAVKEQGNFFVASISKIETPSDCGSETNLSTSLNSSSDACSQSSSVNLPPHLPSQPAPLPQFVLASGHLVQGIQGAQLLTPTSQGKWAALVRFKSARLILQEYFFRVVDANDTNHSDKPREHQRPNGESSFK